jgi:hypothetical protein
MGSSLLKTLGTTMLLCALARSRALGQEAGHDAEHPLAMQLQNPVAAPISVPFQSNFEWGGGPGSKGFKYTLNFQPVIPISISEDWNLISRTIVPVIEQDDVVPDSTQGGLGDILQSVFLSPKAPGPGEIIWGAGPAFLLPTSPARATEAASPEPFEPQKHRYGDGPRSPVAGGVLTNEKVARTSI